MNRRLCFLLALLLILSGCAGRTEAPASPVSGSSEAASAPAEPPAASEEGGDAPAAEVPSSAPEEQPAPPQPAETAPEQQQPSSTEQEEDTEMKLNVQVGDRVFLATLEDNAAVDALVEMMKKAPVVIQMRDYAGFEKVGSLGTDLPASDRQTTTRAGDIVLYTGNQLVIFYGSNSWSYTRLGRIDDLTGWKEALGSGDVTVSLSIG